MIQTLICSKLMAKAKLTITWTPQMFMIHKIKVMSLRYSLRLSQSILESNEMASETVIFSSNLL